jgi:hypothetical protein
LAILRELIYQGEVPPRRMLVGRTGSIEVLEGADKRVAGSAA